jgi:hypothetical protein
VSADPTAGSSCLEFAPNPAQLSSAMRIARKQMRAREWPKPHKGREKGAREINLRLTEQIG